MNVTQIRYFLALCAERNFTRAAKRCGVAQPSLTNAIRALERSLGGALFVRKPKVCLSPFGQMLQPHLELIWRQFGLVHEVAACHLSESKITPRLRRVRSPDAARLTVPPGSARLRRAS